MDSGSTHHITNALDYLHLNLHYHGKNELLVDNGTCLPITDNGKTSICIPSHSLQLLNILHFSEISKKKLSISSLCQTNHISVEFFLTIFW